MGERTNDGKKARRVVSAVGATVTALDEGRGTYSTRDVFPAVDAGALEAAGRRFPDVHPRVGTWTPPYRAFAIRERAKVILVDAGIGELGEPPGTLLDMLDDEHVRPEEISAVIVTHLHPDHVGGLVRDGRPTFPRAIHYVPRADWRWLLADEPGWLNERLGPLERAGVIELVDGTERLSKYVRLEPSPGHTAGHQSVWVGDDLVVVGDVLLHPWQLTDPAFPCLFDWDVTVAARTRESLLRRLAQQGAIVGATHLPATGLGRLLETDEGFAWHAVGA